MCTDNIVTILCIRLGLPAFLTIFCSLFLYELLTTNWDHFPSAQKNHLLMFPLVGGCLWQILRFCLKMYILAEYEFLGWHLFPLNTVKIFPVS